MSFGEKTGRTAFFAMLGREVVRLNDPPTSFVDPVCIGRSVQICEDGRLPCAADVYVTPTGAVAVTLPSVDAGDLVLIQCCADVIRTWTHERLDDIASDFFYETEGQAALVIDVMARLGLLTYSDKGALYSEIDRALASGDFLLLTGAFPFPPARYSRRQFIDSFCGLRGIDPDDMTGFICELETVDGVSAVLLGSDLVVSYSPVGPKGPIPLFYFRLSSGRSDLCVSPRTLRYALEKNSLPLSAADGLFEFFAGFADKALVRPSPEDGSVGLLYLLPDALFSGVQGLVGRVKEFSRAIS